MRLYAIVSLCGVIMLATACTLTTPDQAPVVTEQLTPETSITPTQASAVCRVVNDIQLAMRVSASISAREVAILAPDSTSQVIGRRGDNSWWQVRTPAGTIGWVDASAVNLYGECSQVPVTDAPTLTPNVTSTPAVPVASIKVSLNVRSGPSVRFNPPIGRLSEGDMVDIIGVNSTRDWYKISYQGRQGWISGASEYVDLAGNLASLPMDPGPPTPTASNTPIPSTPTPTLDPNTNYIQDPSFEGLYTGRGSADFNVPEAWQAVYYETPRDYDWQNRRPYAFPHRTAPEIRSGEMAMNFNRDFATFTAVLYQQVTVPNRISVTASAWAWVHTCDPQPSICNSDPGSNARVRVGIDPNGGTDPLAQSVVWSDFISPHDQWGIVGTSAVANGNRVTVFLYGTQDTPRGLNRLYWDDAQLNVGG